MRKHTTILTPSPPSRWAALRVRSRCCRPNAPAAAHPVWHEVVWPFPMDQWGKGTAFRCNAADCGTEIIVYLRAKIGFCNCATGVSDDEDLDRISDFDLFGDKLYAQAPGPAGQGRLDERPQPAVHDPHARKVMRRSLSVGLQRQLRRAGRDRGAGARQPAAIEPAVLEFLNSKTVLQWAEVTLGL